MLDVSWGETLVIIGLSVTFIGRKDLPKASKFLGNQVGRLVGILQGARARADLFAQNNELHALQNELRSGLRELDTVKGELAVAASSRGLIGRGLQSTIVPPTTTTTTTSPPGSYSSSSLPHNQLVASSAATTATSPTTIPSDSTSHPTTNSIVPDHASSSTNNTQNQLYSINLSPRYQSVAAVAEEEWAKRGIGFKSRAEQTRSTSILGAGSGAVGSNLLADFIQQNLIHDQYDRAIMEQDLEIQKRMEQARQEKKKDTVPPVQ
jgi:hypothetical protein